MESNSTRSQILIFQDDTVELFQNNLLSNRQYLIRFTGWNNYYDFRASHEDLVGLVDFISSFIKQKTVAVDCAYFVFDSEWVQDGYQRHIEDGEDPRDHILYSAAVILGKTENFQDDIDEYLKNRDE